MGVALHGNIVDFGLAEVFQLIGQQRKTGVLEIKSGKLTMRLQFAEGAVVSASPDGAGEYHALGDLMVRCGLITRDRLTELAAESESSARPLPTVLRAGGEVTPEQLEGMIDLLTRETIFQVLRWTKGSFHFSAQSVEHSRPPERLLAAEQILMDGLRMVDEWRTFAELVPSGDTVFQRCGSFAMYREQGGGLSNRAEQAERLFQMIDGRLSVRRVIDLSRLGTFEGTRILADLRRLGVIEPVDAREVRRVQKSEGSSWKPVLARARWAVAVAFPMAALAATVALVLGPDGPFPELPFQHTEVKAGWPIPRAPIEEARESFEIRTVRNASEAYRYLHGQWPANPASLAGSDVAPVGALTASADEPYYYVRREGALLILAPQR